MWWMDDEDWLSQACRDRLVAYAHKHQRGEDAVHDAYLHVLTLPMRPEGNIERILRRLILPSPQYPELYEIPGLLDFIRGPADLGTEHPVMYALRDLPMTWRTALYLVCVLRYQPASAARIMKTDTGWVEDAVDKALTRLSRDPRSYGED